MKYKHIVFDVDGTLVDTAQTALTCLQRVLYEETGRQIDLETLYPLFGIPCLELAIQFGTPDPARAVLKWQEYDRQQLKNVRLFSGITQMLDVLHRTGCTLGIVTSRCRREIQEQLQAFHLEPFFSVSVCSDDTERRKPFPEPLLKYLELSGAKSTEVLYIGDSEHDMACAKAVGVDCGLAMWGRSYAKKNPSADFYFVSPEEITNLICE